jgi:multicomponent Na+:H+ antiporter subunit D
VQALFILVPLVLVVLLNLPFKQAYRKTAFYAAVFTAVFQMVLSLTSGFLLWKNITDLFSFNFIANLGVDFFSLVVLFTIGLISLISIAVCRSSYDKDKFNFFNLILIVMMGMNGVVLTRDIFSLYVFLEITAVTSFILIAMDKGIEAFEGAFKYLVLSALATIFILSAIAFTFNAVHSLSYTDISSYLKGLGGHFPPQIIAALVLFITGLSIKAGVVPFHGWLPDAYMSSPSAVSILLAGIVTKVAGVYTIMRFAGDIMNNITIVSNILMAFGALSIVIGALAAIGQKDFKRILAYSSISQIGYIILATGAGTPLAFAGALLHFFNHATFKSLLFVNSAAVEYSTGTRDIDKLGGLAGKMPVTGVTSIIGFLSTMGMPPMAGFWSKLIIIIAVWTSGNYTYSVIALLASILTLAYFLILQRKVFFGKLAEGLRNVKEAGALMSFSAILLALITVAAGLAFPFIIYYLQAHGLLKLVIS